MLVLSDCLGRRRCCRCCCRCCSSVRDGSALHTGMGVRGCKCAMVRPVPVSSGGGSAVTHLRVQLAQMGRWQLRWTERSQARLPPDPLGGAKLWWRRGTAVVVVVVVVVPATAPAAAASAVASIGSSGLGRLASRRAGSPVALSAASPPLPCAPSALAPLHAARASVATCTSPPLLCPRPTGDRRVVGHVCSSWCCSCLASSWSRCSRSRASLRWFARTRAQLSGAGLRVSGRRSTSGG